MTEKTHRRWLKRCLLARGDHIKKFLKRFRLQNNTLNGYVLLRISYHVCNCNLGSALKSKNCNLM